MQPGHPWEVYEQRRLAERAAVRRQAVVALTLGALLGTGVELMLLGFVMRVIPMPTGVPELAVLITPMVPLTCLVVGAALVCVDATSRAGALLTTAGLCALLTLVVVPTIRYLVLPYVG